jgi:hypothetical protein
VIVGITAIVIICGRYKDDGQGTKRHSRRLEALAFYVNGNRPEVT